MPTRREAIQTALMGVAASVLPAQAFEVQRPVKPPTDTLLSDRLREIIVSNVTAQSYHQWGGPHTCGCPDCLRNQGQLKQLIDLNLIFAAMNPDIIRLERMMTGPCSLIFREDGSKAAVTAMSRYYKAKYSLEFAQDMRAVHGEEVGVKLLNMRMARQLSNELRAEAAVCKAKGLEICPYIPVNMVRAVEPDTFYPTIGFSTRYGYLKTNPTV